MLVQGGAMLNRFVFAAVLAAAATGATASETVIGGVSINLPVPPGFCELSASNPADNNMITTIGGLVAKAGNKLLNMAADCQQLASWRAHKGNYLDDYAQYQTPAGQMDQLVASPQAAIKDTCQTLRKQGSQLVANGTADMKSRIEETLKKVKLNEVSFLGVLDEDANACYAGQVQKMQVDNGSEKTQVILIGITVIKNKSIFVYRMAVYRGPDTAAGLLGQFKAMVATLSQANK
jgi:hypothetical protein